MRVTRINSYTRAQQRGSAGSLTMFYENLIWRHGRGVLGLLGAAVGWFAAPKPRIEVCWATKSTPNINLFRPIVRCVYCYYLVLRLRRFGLANSSKSVAEFHRKPESQALFQVDIRMMLVSSYGIRWIITAWCKLRGAICPQCHVIWLSRLYLHDSFVLNIFGMYIYIYMYIYFQ